MNNLLIGIVVVGFVITGLFWALIVVGLIVLIDLASS